MPSTTKIHLKHYFFKMNFRILKNYCVELLPLWLRIGILKAFVEAFAAGLQPVQNILKAAYNGSAQNFADGYWRKLSHSAQKASLTAYLNTYFGFGNKEVITVDVSDRKEDFPIYSVGEFEAYRQLPYIYSQNDSIEQSQAQNLVFGLSDYQTVDLGYAFTVVCPASFTVAQLKTLTSLVEIFHLAGTNYSIRKLS